MRQVALLVSAIAVLACFVPTRLAARVTRMKVVWGVFNNANQRVATFDYPKRQDADELANKLSADKKAAHFVQPIKEPFEENKER